MMSCLFLVCVPYGCLLLQLSSFVIQIDLQKYSSEAEMGTLENVSLGSKENTSSSMGTSSATCSYNAGQYTVDGYTVYRWFFFCFRQD